MEVLAARCAVRKTSRHDNGVADPGTLRAFMEVPLIRCAGVSMFLHDYSVPETGTFRAAKTLVWLTLFAIMILAVMTAQGAGMDHERKRITLSLTSEPPSLDSSLSQDTTSNFVLTLTSEGLVRIDAKGRVFPGVAERWELRERGARFFLRKDARWADGKPVTAHDFVFSWRRLVDPKTAASGSTFFAYTIEHAEDIIAGKLPPDALSVTAMDDHTLDVTTSRPVPYFLNIIAGTAYRPLRESFVNAQHGRYGADAANLLSNGPFILDSWIHNSSMRLNRNEQYWARDEIRLAGMDIGYITADTRSLMNLFKSGELAALRLDENILKDAAATGARIRSAPTNCPAWMLINVRPDRVTHSTKLRAALAMAFDRDGYVNNIVGLPGTRKADSVFTTYLQGVRGPFLREYPAPEIDFDPARARALLAESLQELGLATLPPLILLANETRQIEAEFIQSQIGRALGIEIRVDKQTFKQAIDKMQKGDFDLARAAFCGGALPDPVFFAGIFDSASPYNNGGYQSERYDELMAITHNSGDPLIRMNAFSEMQQILFEDLPIIPTHQYSWIYLQDPDVDGLIRFPVVDFSRGHLLTD